MYILGESSSVFAVFFSVILYSSDSCILSMHLFYCGICLISLNNLKVHNF